MNTISLCLATFNEKDNIERCLDACFDWVDEIVIVDGGSTDGTIAILEKYKKKLHLIKTDNPPMFHINKQKAMDSATSQWILQLDADEVVTPKLANEIKEILSRPSVEEVAFTIPRLNYFLGRFLRSGGVYPDRVIRLIKKGKAYLPCLDIHELMQVNGVCGDLKNDLLHYDSPTFERYLKRWDRYTSLAADDLIKNGFNTSSSSFINYFVFKPIFWFMKTYFRHRGYRDGFAGFIFHLFSAIRFWVIYIKAREKICYTLKKYELF